jgi:BlaI family penicillinase repressor
MARSAPPTRLSRRESEIMEIIYLRGRASAAEVHAELQNPPVYSGVRKQLEILEGKGLLRHEQDGRRYVYFPVVEIQEARLAALRRIMGSLFRGDVNAAMVALLSVGDRMPTSSELNDALRQAREARRRGR